MKKGPPPVPRLPCSPPNEHEEDPLDMLHTGLDLSRKKVDVCLLSDRGEHIDQLAVPPDVDSLKTLARRIVEVHREPVRAVIESMTGARLVHDTLEAEAGTSRSPTHRRSRDSLRWPARPTGSTHWSWRCSATATWCRRSGFPIPRGTRAREIPDAPGQAQVGAQVPDPL